MLIEESRTLRHPDMLSKTSEGLTDPTVSREWQ